MSNNIVDTSLPRKHDTEDKIFNHCNVEIEEFTEFITKFKDIEGPYHKRFLSQDFHDLKLDHVRFRKNGDLTSIEHHVILNTIWMSRDFEYVTLLHRATGRYIHPFIFNTGDIPKTTVEFATPTSFYNPTFVNTQEIEGSVRLNNINYKIDNNQPLNAYDALDIIWMPKYRWDRDIEDIVVELVGIYNNIIIDEYLHNSLRKPLILWAGKYVIDEKNIEIVKRGLKMSAQEVIDLKRDIVTARIDGMLTRAENNGKKEGIKEGKEEGIKEGKEEGIRDGKLETAENMLKKGYTIADIIDVTGLSEKDILNSEKPN